MRFGLDDSVLTAIVTSNTSTGSYDSMQVTYQPLGVMVPLVYMLLGELVFGGLGAGVSGIIMAALGGNFTQTAPTCAGILPLPGFEWMDRRKPGIQIAPACGEKYAYPSVDKRRGESHCCSV